MRNTLGMTESSSRKLNLLFEWLQEDVKCLQEIKNHLRDIVEVEDEHVESLRTILNERYKDTIDNINYYIGKIGSNAYLKGNEDIARLVDKHKNTKIDNATYML